MIFPRNNSRGLLNTKISVHINILIILDNNCASCVSMTDVGSTAVIRRSPKTYTDVAYKLIGNVKIYVAKTKVPQDINSSLIYI